MVGSKYDNEYDGADDTPNPVTTIGLKNPIPGGTIHVNIELDITTSDKHSELPILTVIAPSDTDNSRPNINICSPPSVVHPCVPLPDKGGGGTTLSPPA